MLISKFLRLFDPQDFVVRGDSVKRPEKIIGFSVDPVCNPAYGVVYRTEVSNVLSMSVDQLMVSVLMKVNSLLLKSVSVDQEDR